MVHREVDAPHLSTNECLRAKIAMPGAANLEFIALNVQRRKERKRVDVVPVRMRNQNACG